ncbi:reverse transcriptase domain-containing protein [Tanacetum coccineum]
MSTNEQTPLSQPTSAVRNTLGKEQAPQDSVKPVSDEALREYCDKNYHQILPIIAEKVHQEKVQQEKLKAVKARLNFEEASRHSSRHISKEIRKRMCPHIQKTQGRSHAIVVAETQKVATKVLALEKHKSLPRNIATRETTREERKQCQKVKEVQEGTGNPFTPRIRYFDFPRTRMPSHIKTYDESEDPEDHLKIFQAAAKTERWAMPTWCHMFNSTPTRNARVWFDDLLKESIDGYDDLSKAFLENYLHQKKCIKDPVEIHNIKQSDRESTEEFVRRWY